MRKKLPHYSYALFSSSPANGESHEAGVQLAQAAPRAVLARLCRTIRCPLYRSILQCSHPPSLCPPLPCPTHPVCSPPFPLLPHCHLWARLLRPSRLQRQLFEMLSRYSREAAVAATGVMKESEQGWPLLASLLHNPLLLLLLGPGFKMLQPACCCCCRPDWWRQYLNNVCSTSNDHCVFFVR